MAKATITFTDFEDDPARVEITVELEHGTTETLSGAHHLAMLMRLVLEYPAELNDFLAHRLQDEAFAQEFEIFKNQMGIDEENADAEEILKMPVITGKGFLH